jgi:hypothetical protein
MRRHFFHLGVSAVKRRLLVAPAVAAAAAALATGSGAVAAGHFSGHGIAFDYPAGWYRLPPGATSASQGNLLWSVWIAPTTQRTTDLLILASYRSLAAITAANRARYQPLVTAAIRRLVAQGGGSIRAGPTPTQMGGLPGYRFSITIKAADGTPAFERLILVWRGRTEYFLSCQYRAGGGRASAILHACDQVSSSFSAR